MRKLSRGLVIVILLGLCASCISQKKRLFPKTGLFKGQVEAPRVTVWVHGTNMKSLLPFNKLIENFTKTRLVHFDEKSEWSMNRDRAKALNKADSKNFQLEHFYFFIWTGLLSHIQRAKAAIVLYNQLMELSNKLKKEFGREPIITLIAHSHGGNVVLNMADVNENNGCDLLISKLILFACPVQSSTEHFSSHCTFKRIYSFYSTFDVFQVAALQDSRLPAKRKFKCCNSVAQIKTRWRKRGFFHNDFKTKDFLRLLPAILEDVDEKIDETGCTDPKGYFLSI